MYVAVAIPHDGLLDGVYTRGRVLERRLEEVAVDVREGGGAGIGRIDDVDAAFHDGDGARGQLEVMVNEHARPAAELQDLAVVLRVPVAELGKTDAEARHGVVEDVAHGNHGGDAPLRQIAAQPEGVGEVVEAHACVVVGQHGGEVDVAELVL